MAQREVFQLKVYGQAGGQLWNNVLHYRQAVDDTGSADDLVAGFLVNVPSTWRQVMVNTDSIQGVECRQLTPDVADPVVGVPGSTAGSDTGDTLPSFCSVVIQFRTGFASRRKRGRIYMPGIQRSYVADNQLNSTGTTAYNAFVNGLNLYAKQITENGATFDLGIWSRTEYAESADIDAAFTPVTSISVSPRVATMRRRKLGVGS